MSKFTGTFLDIFYDNLRPLRFVTIPLFLCAAIGLFLRDAPRSDGSNLTIVATLMPDFVWAMLFLFAAFTRSLCIFYRPFKFTRVVTPVLATWLWSLLLFVGETVPPTSTMSLLYLIPMFMEFWILAQYLDETRRGVHDR
jgi:hypothetical protein